MNISTYKSRNFKLNLPLEETGINDEIVFSIDDVDIIINFNDNEFNFIFDTFESSDIIEETDIVWALTKFIEEGIFIFEVLTENNTILYYYITPNWIGFSTEDNLNINNLFVEYFFGSPDIERDRKQMAFECLDAVNSGFLLGNIPLEIAKNENFVDMINVINNTYLGNLEGAKKLYFDFLDQDKVIPFTFETIPKNISLYLFFFTNLTGDGFKYGFIDYMSGIQEFLVLLDLPYRMRKIYKQINNDILKYCLGHYKSDIVMFGEKTKNRFFSEELDSYYYLSAYKGVRRGL